MVIQRGDGTVEFRFFRPDAQRVVLTGDFNDWNRSGLKMTRTSDGYWLSQLRLPPGFYQFRYLADGKWYLDHASFGIRNGPLGPNSVAKVDQ
jgi:1,4-alpha-glucan branching enzyme